MTPRRVPMLRVPRGLVVLQGHPAGDITALARVRYTLRRGRVIWESGG